jgi:lysozyme
MALTNKQRAGWCAIAVSCVSGFEGVRQYVYKDPVGIDTWCFGETQGPKPAGFIPIEACKGMLADSLELANRGVDACIKAPLPDYRRAALVSFTYNVGQGNLCGSTLARKMNAGDVRGACDELTRWNRAKGIVLPGLTKRRAAEREMCLKGAA